MQYLLYTFELTSHALDHLEEFWQWMKEREPWFYDRLPMVRNSSWRVEHGEALVRVHHCVTFDDRAALAAYRAAIAGRGRNDPAWESRRAEQDLWYRITARTEQCSPPVGMGFDR